jgi:hypothetical protein
VICGGLLETENPPVRYGTVLDHRLAIAMARPLRVLVNRENVKHAAASNSLLQRILQRIYRF